MPSFQGRSYEAEMMDDFQGEGPDWSRTLEELEAVNRWLGGYDVVLKGLDEHLRAKPLKKGHSLRIADLGSGGGDVLRKIAQWAKKKNVHVELTGVDANPYIVDWAIERSRSYPNIQFQCLDITSPEWLKQEVDVITCSLFCHHFHDDNLISFWRQWREQAQRAVIVNDLHRHPLAYYSIKWIAKGFSKSPLFLNDAPLSVLRGFSKKEIEEMLTKAGISSYDLRWMWAFRWQLVF